MQASTTTTTRPWKRSFNLDTQTARNPLRRIYVYDRCTKVAFDRLERGKTRKISDTCNAPYAKSLYCNNGIDRKFQTTGAWLNVGIKTLNAPLVKTTLITFLLHQVIEILSLIQNWRFLWFEEAESLMFGISSMSWK